MSPSNPVASLPLKNYFSHLAKGYNRNTANTTLDVFTDILKSEVQTSDKPINASSIVHDNAAGPGIATAGILAVLRNEDWPKEILVSDNNEDMVTGARDSFDSPTIKYQNLDAHDLSSLQDNYFTHSVTNFSIFTFKDAEGAMGEVHRTLKPEGQAIVTSWERFAVLPIVRQAQKTLRPDLPPMPVPGPRFFDDGELEKVLAAGGFKKEKMRSFKRGIIVSDEALIAGVRDFMAGPFMQRAREGFTEEEVAKWPETIDAVVKEEIAKYGGIKFQCFIAIATK